MDELDFKSFMREAQSQRGREKQAAQSKQYLAESGMQVDQDDDMEDEDE